MDTTRKTESLRTAFLLANWYSGATLATLLLDRHPQIVSNGEGFYHTNQASVQCSCGQDLKYCEFYRVAASGMWRGDNYDEHIFRVTPHFDTFPYLQKFVTTTKIPLSIRSILIRSIPSVRRMHNSFVGQHVEFMKKAVKLANASVYLDATKSIRRAEVFLSSPEFSSSPIILLVRNPLSWCASWLQKERAADVRNAIRTWKAYIEQTLRLRARYPAAPFSIIKYEELCAEPDHVMADVERFVGVDPTRTCGDRHESHVLGNQMRFTFDGIVQSARDESWKLDDMDRERIRRHCGRLMEDLGYSR